MSWLKTTDVRGAIVRPSPTSSSTLHFAPQRTGLDKLTFVLLCCLIFSVPFETTFMMPGFGTISRLIGAILLPVGVLAILARGWMRRLAAPHWCMIAFAAWNMLSYFWTVSQVLTTERIFTEVQLVLVVLLVWQFCAPEKDALTLIRAYVCGTLISCGETVYRFLSHQSTYYERFSAVGFDPNDLSLTLAISVPLSYYLFVRHRGWVGCAWLLQIAAVIVACLLTASRTGALVVVLGLSLALITIKSVSGARRVALGLLAVLVVLGAISFTPASSWKRLSTIGNEVRTGTLDSRTEIWAGGLELVRSKPFFGVGAGAFQDAVEPVISYFDVDHAYVAHNTFLSVMAELGLFGFILFSIFIVTIVATILKMEPLLRKTYSVAFLVWVVGVMTLTWEHRKPTWILFAFILQTAVPAANTFAPALTNTRLTNGLRLPQFAVAPKR
ncbi:MAG: O-antigen ligase family protein [Acidobacteriota bacterium]|nr:O-antigen ligase family protein [Acidobacteriota bacterium]